LGSCYVLYIILWISNLFPSYLLCNLIFLTIITSFSFVICSVANTFQGSIWISNCCNFNIGFKIKCEVQGPMRPKVCLSVKHILTNEGKCKGWILMIPECTPTLGVALMWELWMFRTLVEKLKKHQIGPVRHH
jgi:hypothetical protein